jgi:hypothetical protein
MTRSAWLPSLASLLIAAAGVAGCTDDPLVPYFAGDRLALGTWGGDNAGVIATDSVTHVHIGCTFGDVPGRVALDTNGRFSVSGSYMLRAYPIAVGPTVPAQFNGQVVAGTLTLSIAVNDTVQKKQVPLGPVTVVYGKQPQMGPCPICRVPRRAH